VVYKILAAIVIFIFGFTFMRKLTALVSLASGAVLLVASRISGIPDALGRDAGDLTAAGFLLLFWGVLLYAMSKRTEKRKAANR